jgi:predicted metal-dependent HD superfamily phosphohydrolase
MNPIVKKAESFILQLMNEKLNPNFIYHNFSHTQYVVKHIIEIAEGENLSEEDTEMVILAAWFHDTGYVIDIKKHENHSIAIAKEFLDIENYPEEKSEKIYDTILGTIHNKKPSNYFQQIICDADFAHLASSNYIEKAEILKAEFELTCNLFFSKNDWIQENITVFKNHKYYTRHANNNWVDKKNKNLITLQKSLKKSIKKVDADNKSERSVDTLFRVTLKNHITLSDIADTKANILLSVNAIIISMLVSNLIPKFDNPNNYFLIYPSIVFIIFSTISIVLSIMATRPNITSGKFTKEDVNAKKVNLLFFGNFHNMKLIEFEEALKDVMNDKDYLYSSMTKDLYFLGQVLNKKYKLLRFTYTVFMLGIIISILCFGISYYFVRTGVII